MLFNSINFLIFFPIVVIIFFLIPKKTRYLWLLAASYYFYMSWNPKYALLIACSTFITYVSSLLIERYEAIDNRVAKKCCIAVSLIVNLGILCIFKYVNFFFLNIQHLASLFRISLVDRKLDLLLPVGISFYTFQVLGYTLDVYQGKIRAEKNLFKYALFVSFFPQLVAGPIERSQNLLKQFQSIESIHIWNFGRIRDGFLMMMWGLFLKLVIADRASLLVDNVINNYQNYGFIEITISVILFAFQIYCDFSGYTYIARRSAKVMGFSLMNNFRQPYFAENVKDFWRRWHISLTSWFTDYLYIPLGGNRKGMSRTFINTLIVFGISGLWHGASWNFVVWGIAHAVFLLIGNIKRTIRPQKTALSISAKIRKRVITFILVDFIWIFFVCNNLLHSLNVIRQMFLVLYTSNIYSLGLSKTDWCILLFSIVILAGVDFLHEKGKSIFALVHNQEFWFRWLLYLGLFWAIILLGVWGQAYDVGNFIYFQF